MALMQALGMLFWHKHDLDRATQDLANFTPFPDEWSVEDKVLFEQAFQVLSFYTSYNFPLIFCIYTVPVVLHIQCVAISDRKMWFKIANFHNFL